MRKSERDALLERAKKSRRGQQQRAGFTDYMAMSESPLVKQAKERLDGRKGAKATSGTLSFKPKTAQADTKTTKQVDTKAAQAKRKASDAMSSKKKTPTTKSRDKDGLGTKSKPAAKKYNVGVSKGGVSFREAFKHYRGLGQSTFTWNGKKYTTDVKKAKPKAKISTPLPADFTAAGPKKAAPTKPKGGDSKAKAKARDLTLRDKGGVRSKTRLPAGALRKFNSKTGYNSKKERLKKVDGTTYVFKKG